MCTLRHVANNFACPVAPLPLGGGRSHGQPAGRRVASSVSRRQPLVGWELEEGRAKLSGAVRWTNAARERLTFTFYICRCDLRLIYSLDSGDEQADCCDCLPQSSVRFARLLMSRPQIAHCVPCGLPLSHRLR